MVDPFTAKLLLTLAAAFLLRDNISKSSAEVSGESKAIAQRLRRQVVDMQRREALDVLHSAKNQYVSKANEYYRLKGEFKNRLDTLYSDIRTINELKKNLYSEGRHHDIPDLKAKTNELYSVVDDVKKSFRTYGEHVREYNAAVAEIKALIASTRGD